MFNKILIANRGEIAVRIIRTAKEMGIGTVAVYSEADEDALHVRMADEATCLGPAPVAESYLNKEKILAAAEEHGAEAIHPGYGLLSEDPTFSNASETAGIAFIGPTAGQMEKFGLKHTARAIAEEAQVPLVPGTGLLQDANEARELAHDIGYPVMIKSTAGGGGIGMAVCRSEDTLEEDFNRVDRLGKSNFGNSGVFLEKYIEQARHLEVQVFGDGQGKAISLGVRDCSAQRRNQKVIEETPPAGVPDELLAALEASAIRLAESVHYRSAGTVEYIYDVIGGGFYFLEVNTRLQVEHGVTEEVWGVDLVEWMIRLAAGETDIVQKPANPRGGHSIQARIYAENPAKQFQPSSGLLTHVAFPDDVRCDHWVESGTEVSPYYDPLVAKLIVHAGDRPQAIAKMQAALEASQIHGIQTNKEYLSGLMATGWIANHTMTTRTLEEYAYEPKTLDVLRPGTQTTVQDYPGRIKFWDIGVPPSGPMDMLSYRLANQIVGNDEGDPGLEITAHGPRLQFNTSCTVALGGAPADAHLNGDPVNFWEAIRIQPGDILDIGRVQRTGIRCYLCVSGGLDIPDYLGSQATFTLGKIGGHAGRALCAGDVLGLTANKDAPLPRVMDPSAIPDIREDWRIRVLYGPHGAPDFFTEKDIETFFTTDWEVHYNSARTGVRLIGPKPEWARPDGGEAGLHPSNIHDNAYAIGSVDFTGDMPVILGPDGPSLGGFVCPATLAGVDLWKMGQLKPGDKVRFQCITQEEADQLQYTQDTLVRELRKAEPAPQPFQLRIPKPDECLLWQEGEGNDRIVIRQSGDNNILVEFGDLILALRLRFRVHIFHQQLLADPLHGVIDLTPGIRSLEVHYDPRECPLGKVLDWVKSQFATLHTGLDQPIPSRILHLPLSWDDPATQLATQKYMQSVRPDAPWCPDNIEFIRRINGLDTIQQVKDIVFNANYTVLGLGDVYLGAPVATPYDPRHRLVTTKYNPARTWTPENAVGIGGAYMCIYGMEGPGGYQFVGRTLQMWNRYRTTDYFDEGKPWLLRFFDQIKYFPVEAEELLEIRHDFPMSRYDLDIEETTFRLTEYEQFLEENADSIANFKSTQQQAFNEERARWKESDQNPDMSAEPVQKESDTDLPEGVLPVENMVAGSVWKTLVSEGDRVETGQTLAIIESMKMEIPLESPYDGEVHTVFKSEGSLVQPGDPVLGIQVS